MTQVNVARTLPRASALLAIALAFAVLASASGRAALSVPRPISPTAGKTVDSLPAFGWRGVGGADHYEFQIGADPRFNSPVLGRGRDFFRTRNTWATLGETIPNGTYWWHVRAVTKSGAVSPWSPPRSIRKLWNAVPKLLSPSHGMVVRFPTTPLVLRWSPVPYATGYLVYVATDPDLGTLVGDRAIETSGVSYSPRAPHSPGTYYWAVMPVDAQGHKGERSRIASFRWTWPSATTPRVTDLVAAPELFDPQFTWTPVPGAARFEVEINPSADFAAGSRACCDDPVLTTTFSPTEVLKNNRYYWRVRAFDVNGNAGRWNEGPTFTKMFDSAPFVPAPSIRNLHVRTNAGDSGSSPAGFATPSPILVWDPVPGASSYQVEVVPFNSPARPGDCNWTAPNSDHWLVITATPAWTPLGAGLKATSGPFPTKLRPEKENPKLDAGQAYCTRVRAQTDRDFERREVWGDYTYAINAFTFTGYSGGYGAPNASQGDYLLPVRGTVSRRMPLFTWNAIPGAASYFVLVSKDPSFTNVVDYAFTQIPAYAPREATRAATYSDETTSYYWAVLPAPKVDGVGAAGDPLLQSPAAFEKRAISPTLLSPGANTKVVGKPTFRWTPAEGARVYRLQVAQDQNFGTLLDEVLTASTAYTTSKTYSANAAIYWRVRAEDENGVGLTWAPARGGRKFTNRLPTPVPTAGNPRGGDIIPTWTWKGVPGAVSYDLHVDLPDGTKRDFPKVHLVAFTALEMWGTGVFRWQVRAEFAAARGGRTASGPYSRSLSFTKTLSPPSGARALARRASLLLMWQPKIGAEEYLVQISTAPDFSERLESETVDTTSFAPTLENSRWSKGTTFYWRVAVLDSGGNSGNFTPTRVFRLRLPSSR